MTLTAFGRRPSRYARRPGAALLAFALAAALTAWLTAGLSGAAQAQEALTPAQKAERVFHGYGRYGAKYSYGPVTEKNGVLTIRNLKYEVALTLPVANKPGAQKKTVTMKFTADPITVRRYDYRNPELPRFADVTFKDIRPGGSLIDTEELRGLLAAVGRQDLVLDLSQTHELDRAAGSINLDAFAVTMREMLRIDLTGRFDGLDFARLTDPKLLEKLGSGKVPSDTTVGMILDLLGEMRVHRASYALTDLGGIGKAMAVMAAAQSKKNSAGPKLTGPMMRQALAGSLAGAAARFSGSFAPVMLRATARWLLAPGTLTIALRPGRPLPATGIVGYVGAFTERTKRTKDQKIDLDPLQKFLGLSVSYTPAAR